MDIKLACGDNYTEGGNDKEIDQFEEKDSSADDTVLKAEERKDVVCNENNEDKPNIQSPNENQNLKERIANCRKIIESLKLELTEEKAKLQEESKSSDVLSPDPAPVDSTRRYTRHMPSSNRYISDTFTTSDTNCSYSTSVETKLRCDDSLMEYEKQLQRYQETLTMAQNEKKNAIRKQMLAKVYKLKLMEVENQCNIELLRVKQSLECLEPLKVIVNKWKTTESNSNCDLSNYELMPRYPELINPLSTNNLNIFTDDEKSELIIPNEDPQLQS